METLESKLKTIVIVSPGSLPVPATNGGAIESTLQLLIDQNEIEKRIKIILFTPFERRAFYKIKTYKYTKFYWWPSGKLYYFVNFFFRIFRKFLKRINHLDLEVILFRLKKLKDCKIIVHGNTTYLNGIAKNVPKANIVFYVHANLFDGQDERNRQYAELAGKIICVSKFIKNQIIQNTKVDHRLIEVVKNPINIEFFKHPQYSKSYEVGKNYFIKKGDNNILFVGRLVKEKGIIELLKALKLIENKIDFKLIIVGTFGSNFYKNDISSDFENEVSRLALDLESKIQFTGFIHNDELPNFYRYAKIVLMPSICDEAAGKVAMEGMASGIPVITTNRGGIPEYVNENAGYLIETDNNFIPILAQKIYEILSNSELAKKMGEQGLIWAKEFHPKKFYYNYVSTIL